MRKSLVFLTVLVALACTAVALAARPPGGSRFKGTTSAPVINGSGGKKYRDPVVIKVAASRKKIKSFKTGIPSCFGSGGPPPKSNPYTSSGYSAKFKSIKIKKTGKFRTTRNLQVGHVPTHATVSGRFVKTAASKWRVKGKIVYTQELASTCGPEKMTYSARKR